jgi:xylulokinase
MTGETVLGVDVGTGSTKAVLAALDGAIVASAERPHETAHPRPGWFEHDADAIWWEGVRAICAEVRAQAGPRWTPRAVCVSGVGPCVLPADEAMRPLRPAILYGIDTRATAEIAELDERFGAERILARGGSALSSQAVGPKLLWLARNEPGVWDRTRTLFMPSSYAVARLTGEYVLDHHSASQCDPLYELASGRWAEDWWESIAPAVVPPPLVWPGEQVGAVTARGSEETGIPAGTPVMAGTIDAWAEAFSVGVRARGDLMLMYGSTMFFVQMVDGARSVPKLWATAGVEPGSASLAAGMATSGTLTSWLRGLVGGVPFERLIEEAASVPPGAEGLLLLPYFAGERSPIYDPDARGVLAGLTLRHGRGHLLRAIYEATAFGVRDNLELFDAAGDVARIVIAGGGTRGALWPQIVSDVTGRAQQRPTHTIGASYGDALLAAIGAGLVLPETDWTELRETIEPDAELAAVYDPLFASYRELYRATVPVVHRLAALGAGER